jgi:hypothetical protein
LRREAPKVILHLLAQCRCASLTSDIIRRKMRSPGLNLLLGLFVVLAASCDSRPRSNPDVVTKYIDLERPTVVAFLRPSSQDSLNAEATASQENVRSAIEGIKICLGQDFVSYRIVTADRIVVRSPGGEEPFELGHFAPLVGALLLRPGSHSRILFAGGGAEALERMLRPVASEYFAKKCDR